MSSRSLRFLVPFTFSFLVAEAHADETRRISNTPSGAAGSAASWCGAVSADGNFVVFESAADDLVAGDMNGREDLFLWERATGAITRVSVSTSGAEADGDSYGPSISADGRAIAFISEATNLAATGGSNQNVFVRDRLLGTTTLVTADATGAGGSNSPYRFTFNTSISADGRRIAFVTSATNLGPADANGTVPDVYVHDLADGSTMLASVDANGVAVDDCCWQVQISGDGNVVAFKTTAQNLPDPPPGGVSTVYAKELATGVLERVDVDSAGVGGVNGISAVWGLSYDGSLILFSGQSLLVPDDGGLSHGYLRDRVAGTTESIGRTTGGGPLPGPDGVLSASMSADGRFVAFCSGDRFVENDSGGTRDLFIRDRWHDVTTLVGVGTFDEHSTSDVLFGAYSGAGNGFEYEAGFLSADGRVLVFDTFTPEFAPNDGNGDLDVFVRVRDLLPATTVHYGAGFPGRFGVVPTLTPDHEPWRGAPLTLHATNPSGVATVAYLLYGAARDSVPTPKGGTLLVDPIVVLAFPLGPAGGSYGGELPPDWWANGLVFDLQLLELDPWAWRGVSFTDGVELTIGDG
ncbi:MAG: PD40 domain-containing protein [Planctomycetes bacterium]|nr:PD40 domain-containing protein [Planctomycetota bacterium]